MVFVIQDYERLLLFTIVTFSFLYSECRECAPQDFGFGSVVCVCNFTYCDELENIRKVPRELYLVYTSMSNAETDHVILTLKRNETFQTILGFGGAFTDAAAININSLSSKTKSSLLNSYFSKKGIHYVIGRVPVGGCDFSTHPYTYDDWHEDDLNLAHFSLAYEDIKQKIPLIREAEKIATHPLALIASPWSSPAWMKSNGQLHGKGYLKGKPRGPYYRCWARYLIRFLEEYRSHNISFWAITAQNEPMNGNLENFTYNCLGFTSSLQRSFIANDLGPLLEQHGFNYVKILMLDDQRIMLPQWAQDILSADSEASKYVAGIAVHWYLNFAVPPTVLVSTHHQFPDKFILATEASEGSQPWDDIKVLLGSWERSENYAQDIIQDLQHWVIGWVDWNLALNQNGGPNWANNFADSPIIVDAKNDKFFKQPMFYAIGHFSKFISPGSVVINITASESDSELHFIACEGSEKSTVVIILNKSEIPKNVVIQEKDRGSIIAALPPRSIQTFIWWT